MTLKCHCVLLIIALEALRFRPCHASNAGRLALELIWPASLLRGASGQMDLRAVGASYRRNGRRFGTFLAPINLQRSKIVPSVKPIGYAPTKQASATQNSP